MSWRDVEWLATLRPLLALLVIIGGLMFFSSIFFRVPGTPIALLNPRHWLVPIWKQRSYFRPPGFALNVTGLALFTIGALSLSIIGWFR
jgi:hypothetical protein